MHGSSASHSNDPTSGFAPGELPLSESLGYLPFGGW